MPTDLAGLALGPSRSHGSYPCRSADSVRGLALGKNPTIGAILGALPIFIATVALIGREFIAIQRFYGQCHALLEKHIVCRDLSPDDFTRFAIYCFIGMVEVFVLFYMSAVIDGHKREAEFALPWRGRPNG
jgi:hypothetical protein